MFSQTILCLTVIIFLAMVVCCCVTCAATLLLLAQNIQKGKNTLGDAVSVIIHK